MSIGNILIRPQMLDRPSGDDGAQALDLLMGLSSRLVEDFIRGGAASRKVIAAIGAEASGFTGQFEPRLLTAREHLLAWLQPYLSIIDTVSGLSVNGAGDILPVVDKLIELAGVLLDDLHSDRLADRFNALADIVENDLGVSTTTFENLFTACFDRATAALAQDFLQGIQTDDAVHQFAMSRQLMTLRRLLRQLTDAAPLPTFNRRALVRDLQLQLAAGDWDEQLDAIRNKLNEGKTKLQNLLPTLQGTLSTGNLRPGNSRAAAMPGQHSWYGSWFRGEGTAVTDRFNLSGEAFAQDIRLDPIPLGFLEHWAHITFVLDEAARALLYGLQMDNGNRVSPALNMGWQIGTGLTSLLAFFVDGKEWADYYGVKTSPMFRKLVEEALTFGGSFEQLPGFRGWLWATWPHDRANLASGKKWSELAYSFFLSLFTLINSEAGGNQKNHEKISGFTKLGRLGGAHLGALVIGRKNWYYSIFSGNFGITVLSVLIGGAFTFAGEVVAWLLAGALGRRLSDRYWRFESNNAGDGIVEFLSDENAFGGFLLWSYVEFYSTWGNFWEGRTDDGKFGLKLVNNADGAVDKQQIEFSGYAPQASSPYKLPFEPERTVFCQQAHLGFSSHNFNTGLIYAVDFLLGENQLVLAMRSGTVVEYRDDLPNGSDLGLNYILIRHDEQDPVHDKGEGGQVVTTMARYEVARPFGVRQAFALMGIPEERIIGTKVQQGYPVMMSGERPGFFNTDILQVRVITTNSNGEMLPSIPFVFRDVPNGGIPTKGKYYNAGNALPATAFTPQHPEALLGWIRAAGANYVDLQVNARDKNDAYVGAHILIEYSIGDNGLCYEYHKIKEYQGDKRRVIIEDHWSAGHPPPTGARYRVGQEVYTSAGDFEKRFAYLAARDVGGNAVDFADGHRPYLLSNALNRLQTPLSTGVITGGGLAGTNEVHLDAMASNEDNFYNGRHIVILRNGIIIQYRSIINYKVEAGVKKIYIEGVWDMPLVSIAPADEFRIGGPTVSSPIPPDPWFAPDQYLDRYTPKPFSDGRPPTQYYPIQINNP